MSSKKYEAIPNSVYKGMPPQILGHDLIRFTKVCLLKTLRHYLIQFIKACLLKSLRHDLIRFTKGMPPQNSKALPNSVYKDIPLQIFKARLIWSTKTYDFKSLRYVTKTLNTKS